MKGRRKRAIYRIDKIYMSLIAHVKRDKKAFFVFCVMQLITLFVFIRSLVLHQYENTYICVLAFIMFLFPPIIEKGFKVDLPTPMEITAYIFVFCAEILGEIGCYYVKYDFWDTMLHTVNGFMFAAIGFCLVDLFNRTERFRFKLSAGFLAIVAFCFSMTIGVMWEFFEFTIDRVTAHDMQKDTVVTKFYSVDLDETNSNIAVEVSDIDKTVIVSKSGEEIVIENGYLDIGLYDTIEDLFVNFVGATLFSIVGYIYIRQRGKGTIAASLIPVIEEDSVFSKSKASEEAEGAEASENADESKPDISSANEKVEEA